MKVQNKTNQAFDSSVDFYDDIHDKIDEDIKFLKELITRIDNIKTILDFGCGTGRLTLPMVKTSRKVTGVDNSTSMIEVAKKKAALLNYKEITLNFVKADMVSFVSSQLFDFIFCGFNSFQHLLEIKEIITFFQNTRRLMHENSTFLIDVFNPEFMFLLDSKKEEYKDKFYSTKLQREIGLFELHTYDKQSQINWITYIYKYLDGESFGQEFFRWKFPMRQFYPQELKYIIESSNFEIMEKWGGYDFSSFDSSSQKQIILCRKTK